MSGPFHSTRLTRKINTHFFILLLNLLLVAVYGTLIRYKISFTADWIPYKNFLHAHSHFAFTGWLNQGIMLLFYTSLLKTNPDKEYSKYNNILWINLIFALGMLISFSYNGYYFLSIIFSFLSTLVSIVFIFQYWRDLKSNKGLSSIFAKSAMLFYLISAIGTGILAYLMASKNTDLAYQQSAILFYLHFQYNGWFLLSSFALIANLFHLEIKQSGLKGLVLLLVVFSFLTFPQSIHKLFENSASIELYNQVSSFIYFVSLLLVIRKLYNLILPRIGELNRISRQLLILVLISLLLKTSFQLLSATDFFGQIAFENRNIVIAYLHLIFLLVISPVILIGLIEYKLLEINKRALLGIKLLLIAFIANVFLLFLSGIPNRTVNQIILFNDLLFYSSVFIVGSLLFLIWTQRKVVVKRDY